MTQPLPASAVSVASAAFTARNGLLYGLLGLPLAFVALPLYVILPNHYAREFGVPLATLGAILLGARLFDALIDPLLGRLSDRLFARSARPPSGGYTGRCLSRRFDERCKTAAWRGSYFLDRRRRLLDHNCLEAYIAHFVYSRIAILI